MRLIDFKTFSKKVSPEQTHLHTDRQSMQRFTDLQLPLYKLLLPLDQTFRAAHPELDMDHINIVCGYFCLPTAVTETGYVLWNIPDEIMERAARQTRELIEVIKTMREQNIYLKNSRTKKISYDNFQGILLPDEKGAIPDTGSQIFIPVEWYAEKEKK